MRDLWLRPLRSLSRRFSRPLVAKPASAKELGFSFPSLNIDAARRQAKLGRDYARTAQTATQLEELNQGRVNLPPHPTWQGDYTDWVADPFEDRNWRFQFHTLRWINPYFWDALAGNEESKQEWKRIVRSWAAHNTPPSQAEDDYAWMDMTDGNRAIQISIGAPLMDEDDEWYLDLLVEHRNWLLNDTHIVEGNHGLHQNLGLFVLAVVLNDEIGTRRAIQRLADQILEAFDDQGLNEEGSVGYHQMNLVWWQQAERRLKLEGYSFPEHAANRLKRAGHTLGVLLLPDGTMPQVGDGNRGKGRKKLHPLVDQVVSGKVKEPAPPTFHNFDNGFTVFHSGWGRSRPLRDESHTIVRHGQDLLRHSHDDRGSVHIYTAGRRWITDGGFHSYQQNSLDRIYTKSRLAHSLIDLPHQTHDITGDVHVPVTECRPELHSAEILDANFQAAAWKRRVIFLPELDTWVIWDRVKSSAEEYIRQQWLIDIGIEVEQKRDNHLVLNDENSQLHMRWFGDQPQFDTAKGNPKSDNKRGLIGIRWKTMQSASSIHALFQKKNMESIVLISPSVEPNLTAELTDRTPMERFDLRLSYTNQAYRLTAQGGSTHLVRQE